ADHTPRVVAPAAGDRGHEPVLLREPLQLAARLRRHRRVLRPLDDRGEHAVDVEEDRGPLRLGREPPKELRRSHGWKDRRVLRLVLIGLAAGLFSALFGVGGGIVIVPLLLLFAAFDARPATATSLAAIGIISTVGVVSYALRGEGQPGGAAIVGAPA